MRAVRRMSRAAGSSKPASGRTAHEASKRGSRRSASSRSATPQAFAERIREVLLFRG